MADGEVVDAPRHPSGPAGVVLVAEGVGEDLDRVGAGDDVAVPVEPAVDLQERQLAVTSEDEEAGLAECGSRQGTWVGRGRWQWPAVERRWAASSLPREGGPQGVADLLQLVEEVEALVGAVDHGRLEVGQPVVQLLPADLELEPDGWGQAGASAVGEEPGIAEAIGAAAVQAPAPRPRRARAAM